MLNTSTRLDDVVFKLLIGLQGWVTLVQVQNEWLALEILIIMVDFK